jgi:hypothetical protein
MSVPQVDLTCEGHTTEIAITNDDETALIAHEVICLRIADKHSGNFGIALADLTNTTDYLAHAAGDRLLLRGVRRSYFLKLAAHAMGMVAFIDKEEVNAQAEHARHEALRQHRREFRT